MCGRYALALRPSQVRQMLEDDDMPVEDAPEDEGDGAPRNSYNFAPGYHGIVYRADTPDWGSGPRDKDEAHDQDQVSPPTKEAPSVDNPTYKLQSMKWGLVPFWTKRNPEYGSLMKTINCRSDSLSTPGGMWASMKARKRCIVVAQGFFEWLKTGPKDKLPHFVKRQDGHLMCFAGLWDCVQYEGSDDKHYTYTIITTDSNAQLKFLHDRMPVVLEPGSKKLRSWLDPSQNEWTRDLQSLLVPFDGKLEVYPVSKEVGKVGNNSPSFIIPLDSKENKSNIANFFANPPKKPSSTPQAKESSQTQEISEIEIKEEEQKSQGPETQKTASSGTKRKATATPDDDDDLLLKPAKRPETGKISATRNSARSPKKPVAKGTQKITNFFTK
ncbi:hypothetical protein G7046_g5668 [Stylonectria norvegica]|nr:hypothetical protein G7046_g5668 [Stylonectria norvegica]